MLNTYFLLCKPTPEVQKAVGYYLETLTRYQNYADANLKAAILPILIGYWSNEKIIDIAQKNYDYSVYKVEAGQYLSSFYQNKHNQMTKQFPDQYSSVSSAQFSSKIQHDLEIRISTFPKRNKPFPNPLRDHEEYKQLTLDNPESIAILALLAQGKFVTSANK
jgi:hypothetical protein